MDDTNPIPEVEPTVEVPSARVPEHPKAEQWKIWVQWLAVLPAVGALICWIFGPLGFWGLCCRIIGSATLWACILVAIDHQEAREAARLRGVESRHTATALWVNLSIPLLLTVFFLFHAKLILSALCVLAIVLVFCFRHREETTPWQGYVSAYAVILVATLLFVSSGCPYCGGCKAKSCEGPSEPVVAETAVSGPEACPSPCQKKPGKCKTAPCVAEKEATGEPVVVTTETASAPSEVAPQASGVDLLVGMLETYSVGKKDVDVDVRVRDGKVEFTVRQP